MREGGSKECIKYESSKYIVYERVDKTFGAVIEGNYYNIQTNNLREIGLRIDDTNVSREPCPEEVSYAFKR